MPFSENITDSGHTQSLAELKLSLALSLSLSGMPWLCHECVKNVSWEKFLGPQNIPNVQW